MSQCARCSRLITGGEQEREGSASLLGSYWFCKDCYSFLMKVLDTTNEGK